MPTVRLEIAITNSADGIFYPGQELIGDVVVTLAKSCTVSKLILTIFGVGKTKWYERSAGRGSIAYRGKERYLYSELVLFQPQDKPAEIPAGCYSHGFACLLPDSLPASFEGKRGHIRYWLKATFERPWRQSKVLSQNFQIVRQLDLNDEMLLPVRSDLTKTFGYWSCVPSGTLYASVELPTSGFVPGQYIPALIQVNNKGKNKLSRIVTMLVQKITYNARKPKASQKVKRFIVCKNITPEITLPEGGVLAAENLQVPWVLPTSSYSQVVEIGYELVVEFEIDTCLFNANQLIRIPVVIGVIPTRDAYLMESNAIRLWTQKS
ncbi:arrestin domain-containing protein 2-like [Uranotaenia lowii]|uniref:arrestin domain-containing protein 2-like n=1 Tax=Uranotaenia lowii TaxID=190385 RepID=UPI00247AB6B7|nr:arrestin domain-containing protein 2-like [Uranotaenia lowii]XP_055610921.1 arrestin domain-containing protein 2-like [Uranotaenia lowii]